jgi:hypothetical protein
VGFNSYGNMESGDYIQSSHYLGYGEKQDDDLLPNFTVAKAAMLLWIVNLD